MTNFEIILLCLLIPVVYVLVYISGKYDILARFIANLEEKIEQKVDREPVEIARRSLDEFNVRQMVDDKICPLGVYLMIEETKVILDKALSGIKEI